MKLTAAFLLAVLAAAAPAHAQGKKPPVDTSQLGKPLATQIRERVEAGIDAKLNSKKLAAPRYFLAMYAYQNEQNNSGASHTFATFTRVGTDGAEKTVTISWLPTAFKKTHELCTFEGFWSALNPSANHCGREPGTNYTLAETIGFAEAFGRKVGVWGPYEVQKDLYAHAVARIELLKSGAMDYLADDRATRKEGVAINCMHAISDFGGTYAPLGGFMGKGIWGFAGAKQVLKHYKTYSSYWLVDAVDESVFDQFVFVP